ncbi:MAG: hypothetical protein ACE5D3_04365 [Candidatus Binatia bacterium]
MELQKIGVKFYATGPLPVDPEILTTVFHRWIQSHSVAGLLIDVADYRHMEKDPCVVLVAHEGHYVVSEDTRRFAMAYERRIEQDGDLESRVRGALTIAVEACGQLLSEPEFVGKTGFGGEEWELFSNDRLLAANDERGEALMRPAIVRVLDAIYGSGGYELCGEPDAKERLRFTVKPHEAQPLSQLLSGL